MLKKRIEKELKDKKFTLKFLEENLTPNELNFLSEIGIIEFDDIRFMAHLIRFGRLDIAEKLMLKVLPKLDCLKYRLYNAEKLIEDYPNEKIFKDIEEAKRLIEIDEKNPPDVIEDCPSFSFIWYVYDAAFDANYLANTYVDAQTRQLNQQKILCKTVDYGFKLLTELYDKRYA